MLNGMLANDMSGISALLVSHFRWANGQVTHLHRFGVDLSFFPTIGRLNRELAELPEFQAAHPSQQPDFPNNSKTTPA